MIYDNANEVWQLVTDKDICAQLKALTEKQKVVVFLSEVRSCSPQQIACYQDKTDRAVRKLLTAAIENIHDKLAPIIREQIKSCAPEMTKEKRLFIERYEKDNPLIDKDRNGW